MRSLDPSHRLPGSGEIFFRRQFCQRRFGRQFDIDADAIRPASGFLDQGRRRFRDGLQMNVAAKPWSLPQRARDRDHLLHRVIGIANDSRAEKQTFDIIAPVKIEREPDDFFRRETRAPHIAGNAVDAIKAVVDAVVREKNFQQRNAAAIRRVAVANARARGGAEAARARELRFVVPLLAQEASYLAASARIASFFVNSIADSIPRFSGRALKMFG